MRYFGIFLFSLLILIACSIGENEVKKVKQDDSLRLDGHLSYDKDDNTKGDDFDLFSEFIPKGYVVLDFKIGDLNFDFYDDAILILKEINEEENYVIDFDDPPRRPLIILTGKEDGSFEIAQRNDNVVLCYFCGGMMGDPYSGIKISEGVFSIQHIGGGSWRWNRKISFRYYSQFNDWVLYKDIEEVYHHQPDHIEKKVLLSLDKDSLFFSDYNGIEMSFREEN